MTLAIEEVTLEAAAKAFRVHPRTIVRAVNKNYNAPWSEDMHHDIYKVADIAKVYGMPTATLGRVLDNRDALLTPEEAAEQMSVRPRTFREHVRRGYYNNARLKYGKIVRYVRSKMIDHAVAAMEDI